MLSLKLHYLMVDILVLHKYNELYYFMNGEVVKKEYLHFYGTINKDYICKLDQIVQSKEYKELNDFV